MKYLVTGGTGLVGKRIVRDLVKSGDDVVIYEINPSAEAFRELLTPEEVADKVVLVRGDVADLALLLDSIRSHKTGGIIHTASLLAADSNANATEALRINCLGTINIFEAARLSGIEKVLWSSSNAIFASSDRYDGTFIPNEALFRPKTIYGATKAFNEVVAEQYHDKYGGTIIGIRYMHIYGGEASRGLFAQIVREAILKPALGQPGRVPCTDALIGWSYVDDPARATVLAAKSNIKGVRSYNIRGDVRPVSEVVDYMRGLLPGADITMAPGGFTGDPVNLDSALIETEVGYQPQWSMEAGVRETVNQVRRRSGLATV